MHCYPFYVALQVESLSGQLRFARIKLATYPSRRNLRQIVNVHSKLKTLALGKTEKLLLYLRQRYYEWSNKSNTLLARMLQEETAQRTTHLLRNTNGTVIHDPVEVANIFHAFVSKLYSLPDTLPTNPDDRDRLLEEFLPVSCLSFHRKLFHFLTPLSHQRRLGKCSKASPLTNPRAWME